MNIRKISGLLTLSALLIGISCTDDEIKPVLGSKDGFTAPVLLNPATGTLKEFTESNLNEEFEKIEWQTADYGVGVSTRYVIEASLSDEFTSPVVVKEVQGSGKDGKRDTSLKNGELNTAMLALGIPSGEQGEVALRVFSFINGIQRDTLYSNSIRRSAIPYQSSECGNFCTVGLIGSATPGGWDIDTDMRLADPEKLDKSTWTVTLYLTAGEVKFRAQDAWDTNWGAADFPSGTGEGNGPNIPIATAGYYKVTFNDQTGAYSFVQAGTSTFGSIGLIGAQSDWGSDIADLTQSDDDPHIWTGTVTLDAGELKFRADDSWDNNWGVASYPSGYGIGGGPNINIPVSGTYFVWFNDASGEFFFGPSSMSTPYGDVGILGDALPGGWDSDSNLIKDPSNPYKWSGTLAIADGEAKFRADDSWDVNWGASGFPGGIAAAGGANIPVKAGTYFITFNTVTGEYYFLK